jgi:hypothetical protein
MASISSRNPTSRRVSVSSRMSYVEINIYRMVTCKRQRRTSFVFDIPLTTSVSDISKSLMRLGVATTMSRLPLIHSHVCIILLT